MQVDPMAALRRPWFRATGEFLKWPKGNDSINREWFVPVYNDFDSETTLFALRPIAPFVWLHRFWEMNRWCLERLFVGRIMEVNEGGYYRDATWKPLRDWSVFYTRNGIRASRWYRPWLFRWPE